MLLLAALMVAPPPAHAGTHAAAPPPPLALTADEQVTWQQLCFSVEDAFDTTTGGFVSKKGVASESAIDLAFRLGTRPGQGRWTSYGTHTVDWLFALQDTLGGGFASRVTNSPGADQIFRTTVIQARRLENLAAAWSATGDPKYRDAARRELDFVQRSLEDGRGGFVTMAVGDQDLVPAVNGIAAHAYLTWSVTTHDARTGTFAHRTLERVWQTEWNDTLGFLRMDSFRELLETPHLADQTEMGRALLLSAVLGDHPRDLERARRVATVMLTKFRDHDGTFRTELQPHHGRFTSSGHIDRTENARAALFLAELAHVASEPRWLDAARAVWRACRKEMMHPRLASADWALALDAAIGPTFPAPVRAEDGRVGEAGR